MCKQALLPQGKCDIPAPRGRGGSFKASLEYILSSKPASTIQYDLSQKKNVNATHHNTRDNATNLCKLHKFNLLGCADCVSLII